MLLVSTDVLVVYLLRLRKAPAAAAFARWRRMTRQADRLGGRSPSASSRSSSRCRRSRCARRSSSVAIARARDGGRRLAAIAVGERRLGWGAIVAGAARAGGRLRGHAVGRVATSSAVVVWGALLAATLRYATPLIFGALGGLFSERSRRDQHRARGHDADGRVLRRVGRGPHELVDPRHRDRDRRRARSSARCTRCSRSRFRADQIVSGTALNLLAVGITGYLYVEIYGDRGHAGRPAAGARRHPADQVGAAARRHLRRS